MELFGIGPLELIFIILIAIIVLGPKEIEKTAKAAGRGMYKLIRSDTWKTLTQTSRQIRTLPNDLIRQAGARAVLTAWSFNARNSTWVYAEAARGLDNHKFLQLRLDNVQLPLPFDALQVADMTARTPEWGSLENTLTRLVRQGASPEPVRRVPSLGPLATPAAAGSPKLLSAATGATLAAYAGALSATYNGVMSPEQLQIALTGMMGVAGASAVLTAHRMLTIARAGG